MRTRRLLAENQLDTFMAYCQTQGWKPKRTLGATETLRMGHPRREDLVVGPAAAKLTAAHPTMHPVYDEASRMFDEWQQNAQKAA